MAAQHGRTLRVRLADRLRASLARDAASGLPMLSAFSDEDQRDLREVGGGRVAAIALRVAWSIDAAAHPRSISEVHSMVMHEVVRIVDEQVRRADLLASASHDGLVILAPGLDASSARSLAERLSDLLADRPVAIGDLRVRLRVGVGTASRGLAPPSGWTTRSLAEEAEQNAVEPPPISSVA